MSNLPELSVRIDEFPQMVDEILALNDSGSVLYLLDIPESKLQGDTPNYLEILGIFLARHLKAMHLISVQESDRLQRDWNAAVM